MKSVDIPDNEPIYTVSIASKLTGVSVAILKSYERQGLVIPFVKESKHRLYSNADIKRIEKIRDAVENNGISTGSIKGLYALIPCWKIKQCNEEDRHRCSSYKSYIEPCWLFNHPETVCDRQDCRECEVYMEYSDFTRIKKEIENLL